MPTDPNPQSQPGRRAIALGGWTTETSLEHVLTVVAANDARYAERFDAQEKAILKSEAATEKRFEGVNEFRKTLDDQQRTLITKSEVDLMAHALDVRVDELKSRMDAMTAERLGVKGGWGYAVGVLGAVAVIVGIGMSLLAFWSKVTPSP